MEKEKQLIQVWLDAELTNEIADKWKKDFPYINKQSDLIRMILMEWVGNEDKQ